MTLPASGQISLSQVQTEFGGSAPIRMSEYYGVASGVPGNGQIRMSHFHGKSALQATLVATSYSRQGSSTLTVSNDGNFYANGTLRYAWCTAGNPTQAEVRATLQGGSFPVGTMGTWLSLSSSRSWNGAPASGFSAGAGTALFEIRNPTSGVILASANITLVGTP